MDLMVIGVLPGHKGRIGHHDHTHFIGQNPSVRPSSSPTPGMVRRSTTRRSAWASGSNSARNGAIRTSSRSMTASASAIAAPGLFDAAPPEELHSVGLAEPLDRDAHAPLGQQAEDS